MLYCCKNVSFCKSASPLGAVRFLPLNVLLSWVPCDLDFPTETSRDHPKTTPRRLQDLDIPKWLQDAPRTSPRSSKKAPQAPGFAGTGLMRILGFCSLRLKQEEEKLNAWKKAKELGNSYLRSCRGNRSQQRQAQHKTNQGRQFNLQNKTPVPFENAQFT